VKLNGNTTTDIQIDWPDMDSDPQKVIASIVAASATGTIPPEEVARLLLTALGIKNVEELIDAMTDDDGKFLWPEGPGTAKANNPADLALAGGSPAAGSPGAGSPGSMQPGDQLGQQPGQNPGDTTGQGAGQGAGSVASGVLERQSDADFGLFGGSGAQPDATVPTVAGPQPKDVYDPAFFHI
jgi:hypothetical protein